MKIYLAAAAPGNETGIVKDLIKNRLLSYYLIKYKKLDCEKVFKTIKDESTIRKSRKSRSK